jgi:hypothetical protein
VFVLRRAITIEQETEWNAYIRTTGMVVPNEIVTSSVVILEKFVVVLPHLLASLRSQYSHDAHDNDASFYVPSRFCDHDRITTTAVIGGQYYGCSALDCRLHVFQYSMTSFRGGLQETFQLIKIRQP